MRDFLVQLSRRFNRTVETVCVVLLVTAVVVAITQVFFRYVVNSSLSWPEEFARFCLVWMVFLGMAVAYRLNNHIVIDALVRLIPERYRDLHVSYVDIIVSATCVALIWHGIHNALSTNYVSPALGIPFTYLYLAAPVGALLNLLYVAQRTSDKSRLRLRGLLHVAAGALVYYALRSINTPFMENYPAWTLVIAAGILVFTGIPIGYGLALSAYIAFFPLGSLMTLTVSQSLVSSLNSFILLAIPFFILAAGVMNVGGITTRLVNTAAALVGHLRGGLGHVNVVTSVLMGGVTGSSSADAGATSKILVPEMSKRGYGKDFSCAVTASSSVLANLIPPSLALIIFGALASVSVGGLFLATIVPGLILAVALGVVVHLVSVRRGYGRDIERASTRDKLIAFKIAVPALILPIGIVGGVRFGVFTATEAGSIAVVYAFIISFLFYEKLGLRTLAETARDAFSDTVAIMFIVAAASPFAFVLVSEQVPQRVASGLSLLVDQPVLLLLALNAFLIVVGLFIELFAAMVILVPILIPIVSEAGINPMHFGIFFVMNLVMGALTPPLGVLAFVTSRITDTPAMSVFRSLVPFLIAMIIVLLLVTYIPAISLTLPRLIAP